MISVKTKGSKKLRLKQTILFYSILIILLVVTFEIVFSLGSFIFFNYNSQRGVGDFEEGSFNILFLGESTTVGICAGGIEGAYSTKLEAALNDYYHGKKINSINRGVNGIETKGILMNIDANMLNFKPDLVVVMAGWNDQFFSEKKLRVDGLVNKFKAYSFVSSIKDFFIIRKTFDVNSSSYIYGQGGLIGNPDFEECSLEVYENLAILIDRVRSYGSEVWFVEYLQPNAHDRNDPIFDQLVEDKGVVLVEVPVVDYDVNRSLFCDRPYDDWHPTDEGHKIITQEIFKRMLKEGIIEN